MAKSVYQIILELEGDKATRDGLMQVGKAAGLSGAALLAFSGLAAKAAMDYQQALANVVTVSDESTGSIEEFSDSLYALQDQMNGNLNILEASRASYDILSAGIKDAAGVTKALEIAQKVAVAGQGDLVSSNKALISVVNAYGDELGEGLTTAERFEKAGNLLIQTQLSGVLTGSEYAASIGMIAATARGAGVSIEELNAAIATSTTGGTASSQAFTRLQAMIAGITVPTTSATKEAERLGIQFNAARLKAVGLEGVLNDITNASGKTADTIGLLFGSVEAQGIATQLLTENGALYTAQLYDQNNAVTALNDTYETVVNTRAYQIENAMNQLQGSLIKIGDGVMLAFAPFLEQFSKVVDVVAGLDPVVLQLIGTAAGISGAVLTVAGGTAILVASIGMVKTNIGLVTDLIVGKMIPALYGKAAANSWLTKSYHLQNFSIKGVVASTKSLLAVDVATTMKGWVTSIGLSKSALLQLKLTSEITAVSVGALLALIGVAIFAAIKLKEDLANARIEQEGIDFTNAIKSTDNLVAATERYANQIKRTGEALPEAEFKAFMEILNNANKEQGGDTLGRQIAVLTQMQADAKAGTDALADSTDNAGEVALTAEEKWKQYQERIGKIVENIDRQANIDMAAFSGDSIDDINGRLGIAEQATARQLIYLQDLKDQSETTAEERVEIEMQMQESIIALNEKRAQAVQQIEDKIVAGMRREFSNIDKQLSIDTGSIEEDSVASIQRIQALRERAAQEQIEILKEIQGRELTTAEEREDLELEIQQKIVDMNRERADSVQAIDAKIQEQQDEIAERNAEIAEERKAAIEEEIALINVKTQTEVRGAQERANLAELEAQQATIQGNILDSQAGIYNRISGLLGDDNTSLETRGKLLNVLGQFSRDQLGIQIDTSSVAAAMESAEGANLIIQQRKLDLKIRQLEIDREQLLIANQIKQLEIGGEVAQLERKLTDESLSQSERAGIIESIESLNSQSNLENQKTDLAVSGIDQSLDLAEFEQRIGEILISGFERRGTDTFASDLTDEQRSTTGNRRRLTQGEQGEDAEIDRGNARDLGANNPSRFVDAARASRVSAANQNTASQAIQGSPLPATGSPQSGQDLSALRGDIQALTSTIQSREPNVEGSTFNFVNDPDPFATALRIQTERLDNAEIL